jgi:hypothetical protein
VTCSGVFRFRLAPHAEPTAGTGGSWWRGIRDLVEEFFDGADVDNEDEPSVWTDDCASMQLLSEDRFNRTGSTVTVSVIWEPGNSPWEWHMPRAGWVLGVEHLAGDGVWRPVVYRDARAGRAA